MPTATVGLSGLLEGLQRTDAYKAEIGCQILVTLGTIIWIWKGILKVDQTKFMDSFPKK